MGFRTLDVNVSGKHADLIRDGKYEIYSADWLRSAIGMLMNEAYECGMQNVFPYDKEMEKACGDGWKELHDEFNKRIDEMLDIGVQRVKEAEFHCGFEESGGHAYNCNNCPNKCDEWHQWDKEFKEAKNE